MARFDKKPRVPAAKKHPLGIIPKKRRQTSRSMQVALGYGMLDELARDAVKRLADDPSFGYPTDAERQEMTDDDLRALLERTYYIALTAHLEKK